MDRQYRDPCRNRRNLRRARGAGGCPCRGGRVRDPDMAKTLKGSKKTPSGDYAIGYARPPQHSRVKPGQVLNPHGRNGKKASEPDAFDKARLRLSRVTIDGEVMMIDRKSTRLNSSN